MASVRPAAYSPVGNLRDNLPCNTLFIGNLGDHVNEAELRGLFSVQPGYRWLSACEQGWRERGLRRGRGWVLGVARQLLAVTWAVAWARPTCVHAKLYILDPRARCRQMKIVRSPKATTAFIEFVELTSAMLAHEVCCVLRWLPAWMGGGVRR